MKIQSHSYIDNPIIVMCTLTTDPINHICNGNCAIFAFIYYIVSVSVAF